MLPRPFAFAPVLLALGLCACGGKSDSPSIPAGATKINGTERLYWDQEATVDELAGLRFFALLDAQRVQLASASCQAASPTSLSCISPLPAMGAGSHTLQILASNGIGDSEPSTPPLSLFLVPLSSSSAARVVADTTSDGVRVQATALASGLADVTDLAAAPDGAVYVAERAGRVRVYRDGALQEGAAAALRETIAAGGELLAIALDPAFASTRRVYALHTARSSASNADLEFRISRFTDVQGTLADQVTLVAGIRASSNRAAGALRFGADGKLCAAFDDGGERRAGEDAASLNGKVVRMNRDGSTPADQASATPVLAAGGPLPRSVSWSPDGRVLWVGETRADGTEQLAPLVMEGRPLRARLAPPYALPSSFGLGGAAFYDSPAVPEFRGSLFVGASTGGYLLRLRFGASDPLTVSGTERLLEGRVGGIRAVAVASDGAIYLATADTLLRLAAVERGAAGRTSDSGLAAAGRKR